MNKIRRRTFQHIEMELENYLDTKKEICQLRKDIIHGSPVRDENGGGRSNLPGDPTGRLAAALTMDRKLKAKEEIVEAIEALWEPLDYRRRRLIILRYWWETSLTPFNAPPTWNDIAKEMGMSRATLLRWRDDIINAIADRLGWE